jgi:hypothetical protein
VRFGHLFVFLRRPQQENEQQRQYGRPNPDAEGDHQAGTGGLSFVLRLEHRDAERRRGAGFTRCQLSQIKRAVR